MSASTKIGIKVVMLMVKFHSPTTVERKLHVEFGTIHPAKTTLKLHVHAFVEWFQYVTYSRNFFS